MPVTSSALDQRHSAAKRSAELSRARAIANYNKNPNYCLHCGEVIQIRDKEKVAETRQKKFCNSTCAGFANSKNLPRRAKQGRCATCETSITTRHKYCSSDCRRLGRGPRPGSGSYTHIATWRQKAKRRAVEYKGGSCQVCGYNRSMRAMSFHHVNPLEKDFGISASIRAWDKIQAELDKCVLLCANCHAEVHDGLLDLSFLVSP